MKALQKFTPEYLELCRRMKPEQIAKFLDDFRRIHGKREGASLTDKSKLISMKVPESLLFVFREKCRLLGVPYQTQIKRLMKEWLSGGDS